MVRRRTKFTEVVIVAIVVLVVAWIFFPPVHEKGIPHRTICLSNLRQIALGIEMYRDDNGKEYPLATTWMDGSIPYIKSEREFHCPVVSPNASGPRYGYALNSKLGSPKGSSSPDLPLVFDSILLNRNANGGLSSLPQPGRHYGHNNLVYADGHAKSLPVQ